jgi:cysteine desulfurase
LRELGANPSSAHREGQRVRAALEQARAQTAALVGAAANELVFVSGGTEGDHLAIVGSAWAQRERGKHVACAAIEHHAVHGALEVLERLGWEHSTLPCDTNGMTNPESVNDLPAGITVLSLMLANNETGVIQPVAEAAEVVRAADGWLHVDAVQSAGKIAVDFHALGADTLSIAAHKFGGPMGMGALAFGPRATLSRRQHGGGQERGRRGGTENVPGIAGFGAAAEAALKGLADFQSKAAWRDAAAERLKAAGSVVMGEAAPRLPNTLNIASAGYPADIQVMNLDLAGVMVSAGAACSSGKVKVSPVLAAMGQGDLAGCAIRVSGGWNTAADEWDRFVEAWLTAHARHSARHAQTAGVA